MIMKNIVKLLYVDRWIKCWLKAELDGAGDKESMSDLKCSWINSP